MYIQSVNCTTSSSENKSVRTFPNHNAIEQMNQLKNKTKSEIKPADKNSAFPLLSTLILSYLLCDSAASGEGSLTALMFSLFAI